MLLLALALSLTATQPDAGGRRTASECRDDNGVDRCDAEVQARTRTLFGVTAIEDEAETGAEIYRAFYVDGYGRDLPTVAFERRAGQGPSAVIYGLNGRNARAAVSSETWSRIVTASEFADRRLEPLPAETQDNGHPPPPPAPCLHSSVMTVEMANTNRSRFDRVAVRRRTEDACEPGPTTRFAMLLAAEALAAIPGCDALEERVGGRLSACLSLLGDRLSAAGLYNEQHRLGPQQGPTQLDPRAWRSALGMNGSPVLIWSGQTVRTDRGRNNFVAEFIVDRLTEHPDLVFMPDTFEGLSAREAVIAGRAAYTSDGISMIAPYRQTWVWDPSLMEWMLSQWTVEAFRPAS